MYKELMLASATGAVLGQQTLVDWHCQPLWHQGVENIQKLMGFQKGFPEHLPAFESSLEEFSICQKGAMTSLGHEGERAAGMSSAN